MMYRLIKGHDVCPSCTSSLSPAAFIKDSKKRCTVYNNHNKRLLPNKYTAT